MVSDAISLWGHHIHPHTFFESLSYVLALVVYLKLRRGFGDPLIAPIRWAVVAVAVAGAALGSRLLFLFEDPQLTWRNIHNPSYLMGGKTIVGALVFGLIIVEAMKRFIGLRQSTGDLYAIPIALGVAVGRIGCFITGLSDNTYGAPASLPWAIDFGDGIARHPTQLYEMLFLLILIPALHRILRAIHTTADDCRFQSGDVFKAFMVGYMSFRLLCDFIKPYPRIFLGLGGIQWACLLVLLYYSPDIGRWFRLLQMRREASEIAN